MADPHRRALNAPTGSLSVLSRELLREVSAYAAGSERRRVIQPFHKTHEEVLHRMLNAGQPGTYVRPHRHLSPPKAEAFVLLTGAVDMLVFDDQGELAEVVALRSDGANFGVDLSPGPFHSLVVRAPDSVLYEVKSGPYEPSSDKDFAPWAPPEGDPRAQAYQRELEDRAAAWLAAREEESGAT